MKFLTVMAFDDSLAVHRISVRLTKSGKPYKADLKQFHKYMQVPLRYLNGGIKRKNPDLGWPAEVLMEAIPEVYRLLDETSIKELRERLLKHTLWQDEW